MPEIKTIKRVAVLGGGIGSISAVYELLKATQNDPNTEYQITLYQLGWRLGGKGASGRNPDAYERIEEHGLHIWFGLYNNAFNQIKAIYDELNRAPGSPLATWKEAFTPENWLAATEWLDGQWRKDDVKLPQNDLEPGGDHVFLSPIEYLEDILSMVIKRMAKSAIREKIAGKDDDHISILIDDKPVGKPLAHVLDWVESLIEKGLFLIYDSPLLRPIFVDTLVAIRSQLKRLLGDLTKHDEETRCAYILLDLAFTVVIGVFKDNVFENGFDSINDYDMCEWLTKHGAAAEAVQSALVRGGYDALFAFDGGDTNKPNFEAGTALKCSLLAFGCRGSVMYKMNAGMGDAIFGPAYELFRRKGVKFEFFHRVKSLELSADKKQIARIQMGRQVRLKDGLAEYQPLKEVKGLPSWPSCPLYEQLNPEDAAALQAGNINLESYWADWQDREELTLELGKDFDLVLYGMSLGPVGHTCQELMAANPRFKAMYENVQTIQTQACQIWTNKTTSEMGWRSPAKVLGAYVEPLDTWSEMNQVLDREEWPADWSVKSISYFCGPMKGSRELPPPEDHQFPQEKKAQAFAQSQELFTQHIAFLWPQGVQANGVLDWDNLVAPPTVKGEDRLQSQFFRANIDPSERYVQTVKGSSRYRLMADETGFDNLYISGDWTNNGMNVGAVESAVISGMLCASAISGKAIRIVGEEILHSDIVRPAAPAGLYESMKTQARTKVDAIKNDPQARIALRKAFYEKYGANLFAKNGLGYGDAEIAFMEWECRRGVLNPLQGSKPGSPWWFNVNLEFLYWGELSQLVYESRYRFDELDTEVSLWQAYIKKPSPATWYRAHNRSIASGYLRFAELAKKENVFERIFMNEVLYRLLYVGVLQMGPVSKLPFRKLMDTIFDPAVGIMNIVEDIPAFYPQNYPMSEEDAINVVYQGKSISGIANKELNTLLMLPHIDTIYALSEKWLSLPGLSKYTDHNRPIYPEISANLPVAKGPVKGKVQSLIVSAALDIATVAQFLPPELELSPQQISPEGTHPVLFFFNENRLHSSWFSWPVFRYDELAFLIPYVNFKGQTEAYSYTPILFVDSLVVAWLGEFVWKFNKLMAEFRTTPKISKGWRWFLDTHQVLYQVEQDDKIIAQANCSNDGQPDMLYNLPNADGLRTMFQLPGLMGRDGKFSKVTITMDLETAEVLPVQGNVVIDHLEGLSVPKIEVPFGPLGQSAFGGMRIIWDITLSSPNH